MQNNYTLKQAVISALALLALSVQGNALALGLSNIDVKSHLGQPLRANIKVLGASELKSEACFRVIGDASTENQLNSANFKLSSVVDDVATLTVTTNQIINEPITNLSITAECDFNVRRDYVLLLDPPLSAEPENNIDEEPTLPVVVNEIKPKKMATQKVQPQTITVGNTVDKSSKKSKASQKTNKNVVLTAGYDTEKKPSLATNNQPSEASNVATKQLKESKPRLSISGGMSSDINLNSVKLQFDKQLHFTPDSTPLANAADAEVQDEVTVMNNRLLHLQKQIGTLAETNKTLKTENTLKSQQLEQANSLNQKLDWLGYILGGALLLGSVTIADKWRRRRQDEQLEFAQLQWEKSAATSYNATDENIYSSLMDVNIEEANNGLFETETSKNTNVTIEKSEGIFKDKGPAKEAASPFSVEEFNADQNILDHADVFLSHGRTSLAMQLLQNHLLDHPKQSVTIWLFLLDLLAKENMQAAYEQTALECKEHFNIRIADFSNDELGEKVSFEDFPRLHSALQEIWDTPAALVFLDDLIYNSRLESRIGFEKTVIDELLVLKNIAHETLNTAEVIQMDEKKLALQERKDAQIAAKKAQKLQQMEDLVFNEKANTEAVVAEESKEAFFEFNLVEYN